jgi:hypothetical protein
LITEEAEDEVREPHFEQGKRATLSGVTRQQSERGNPITICSSAYVSAPDKIGISIAEILGTLAPRSIPERIDRALQNLARKSRYPGDSVTVRGDTDWPLFFSENSDAMGFLIKHMVQSDLLDETVNVDQVGGKYALTVKGWDRTRELKAKEAGAPPASSDVPMTDAEIRQRLLTEFHRTWQGSPRSAADTIYEVAARLGLPAEQCLRNADLLREKGLLECRPTHQGFPNAWRITGSGVESVERGEQKPHPGDQGQPEVTAHQQKTWDVFVCHASEDKDDFVRPLAEALLCAGLKVWYDDFSLKWGDSLRRSVDRGLAASRYGIVVLSPAFFEKQWPQIELDGLVQREVNGENVILPVWHKVTRDDVARFSVTLAGRVARESARGIDAIVIEVVQMAKGDGAATQVSDRIMQHDPEAVNDLTGRLEADTPADAPPAPTAAPAVADRGKLARVRSGIALRFPKEQERLFREGSERLHAVLADFRRRNMIESSFAGSAVCKCISETIGAVAKARVDIELEVLREAGVPLDRTRADVLRQEVSKLVEGLAKGVSPLWQLVPSRLKSDDLRRCIAEGAREREIACHRDIEIAVNAELLRDG